MHRFDKPSLQEIRTWPAADLIWQPMPRSQKTIQASITMGSNSYIIVLTVYALHFNTLKQHGLMLDGTITNQSNEYSIYNDKFDLIRTIMAAIDDYVIYSRSLNTIIHGLTFGSFNAKSGNIYKSMYKDISDYYCEAQPCFIYNLKFPGLLPIEFNLHFVSPLDKETIIDIKNNNVTMAIL